MSGKLILLGLPIGNLKDMSQRVREALIDGEVFACEDTRHLKQLFNHLKLETKGKVFISFHEHYLEKNKNEILRHLKSGKLVYFCSEAGSPIISDPAYPLVKLACEENFEVTSYPGPSAMVMALELSGLPPMPFHFFGFVPRESAKRKQLWKKMRVLGGTCVLFESPHRTVSTLEEIVEQFPDSEIALQRELTKMYESVYRMHANEVRERLPELVFKGEVVLVVHTPKVKNAEFKESGAEVKELALAVLESKGRPKVLSKLLASLLGESPKQIYQRLLDK